MHAVETMAYAGRRPWHGLGTYVGDDAVDSRTMMVQAGLDWTASLKDLWAGGPEDTHWRRVRMARAVVRDTDQQVLGVVGTGYDVLQPWEAFAWLDSALGRDNLRYHTAGSLHDGRVIWATAKVADDYEVVPGDVVQNFILMTTAFHRDFGATKACLTPNRTVCWNTLVAGLRDAVRRISVPHRKNQRDRLREAERVLGFARQQADAFKELATALARYRVTTDEVQGFVEAVVPSKKKVDEKTGEETESKHVERERGRLKALYEDGEGSHLAPGTAWSLLNAATERDWWQTTRSEEARFSSTFQGGANEQRHQRALQYVSTLVAA